MDPITIFIKYERCVSPMPFLNMVIIIVIFEKLHSTDAVQTGIDRQMLAKVYKMGNIVRSISPVLVIVLLNLPLAWGDYTIFSENLIIFFVPVITFFPFPLCK